jgi:hypothetical protein
MDGTNAQNVKYSGGDTVKMPEILSAA